MTSALRQREGGWSKRDDSTDRLREWDSDKGGVGPKIRKFCGRHLSIAPKCLASGHVLPGQVPTGPGEGQGRAGWYFWQGQW